MEELNQLEQMLRTHDWYYMMSEDPRYYRRGDEQRKAISEKMGELVKNGLEDEANQLYAKYHKSLF
jgi:hypothetical protein